VNAKERETLKIRKRNLDARLSPGGPAPVAPGIGNRSLKYEMGERVKATAIGGLGVFAQLAQRIGLVDAINDRVRVFKRRLVYHESDHVLTLALSTLAGGTCLDDTRLLRCDGPLLDALGVDRLPDATTVGDFTRRFTAQDVIDLQEAINSVRPCQWRKGLTRVQREVAYIDVDGTIAPTTGECKEGMDVAFNGVWGYHPLIVSLANTREPLYLVNRSGNRPSDDEAAGWVDKAVDLVRPTFKEVWIRGDTAFYRMSSHFDAWDDAGVKLAIGARIQKPLLEKIERIPEADWCRFERGDDGDPATKHRCRPRNVKQSIVRERGYKTLRLQHEDVAEIQHRPRKCGRPYRVVVLRKNISVEKGDNRLFDEIRYFAYITNDSEIAADDLVRLCNGRCEQENLIEQLKNELRAMRMPVGDLTSNWAHMVMTALGWSLKTWFALCAPRRTRAGLLRCEFRSFINRFVRIPCQVLRTGRRWVARVLSYNASTDVFLRTTNAIAQLAPT